MADNEKKKRTLWEQAVENALRFAFNLAFVFIFQSIFFQFIVSCVLPILSGSAATLQLPLVCFKTPKIDSIFLMPMHKASPTGKSVSPQQDPDVLSLPSQIVLYFPIIE